MTGRQSLRALAVVVAVLCAASCVSIPDSSPVRQAEEVGVDDQTQQITNVVLGPFPGADPAEVVEGFYAAMLAYPRTMDKARMFLTADAAVAWDPNASLTVYDDPQIVPDGRRGVKVTTSVTGSLDNRGSWTSAARRGAPVTDNLRMVKDDGEWRIVNPAPGTLVDRDFFSRFYQRHSLYFFDPSRTVLTPDPVYIAVGGTTATSLVNDLLRGPTADLRGAVTSAAPADTQLDVSVSVSSSGHAEVPLTADVLKLSAPDRQLFAAQLAWTLRQVDEIRQISISVDGADLAIENAGSPFDADAFSGFDPAGLAGERRLFALEKPAGPGSGALVTVNDNEVSPVLGPIGEVKDGSSLAVQTSGQLAAIVHDDGHSIAVGPVANLLDAGVSDWFEGNDLLRPSWDALQVLWVVDQTSSSGARIYVVTADGARRIRNAPGLDGADIVAFAISRDGVRFAAILDDRGERSLVLSTIDRDDPNPARWTVRRPQVVESSGVDLTFMSDLAWVSPTSLAVLGSEVGDDLLPYEVAIDGSDTQAFGGFLSGRLTSIAAGPNTDAPVAVGVAGGEVYVQTPELLWVPLISPARLHSPSYPG